MSKKLFTTATLLTMMAAIPLMANAGENDKAKKLVPFTTSGKSISVYTTAKDSEKRLSLTDTLTFAPGTQPPETEISVFVNPNTRYQTLIGIGGALTDASAEVFAKLPANKQQELLNAYYTNDVGIGYSWGRTTIHSSDFSSASYTYIQEGDKTLSTFSIDHDRQFRIPFIKRVIETAGGKLPIFASPWSPPAFMKSNNDMLHGGTLLPEYYAAWATYYTKFIKAYEKEGIPIWGISVQNEPMAKQIWDSTIYTAEEERDFLKNYLGPIMKKEGLGKKPILVWDHNRDLINHRVNTIMDDPEAAKYAWGIGYHWYETWAGGDAMYKNVADVHEAYPNKPLILTEASIEKFTQERYQYWPNGERYGSSIINDLNNGTVAWTDWNILLDEQGGPNHVGNFCFSPIHADTAKGELIYTPPYYYIGHFSKFIKPNARRISTVSSRSPLLATSFLNADSKMATVVMNQTDIAVTYNLFVGTQKSVVKIPAHAIQTLVY